jgi:hypothetical protein
MIIIMIMMWHLNVKGDFGGSVKDGGGEGKDTKGEEVTDAYEDSIMKPTRQCS